MIDNDWVMCFIYNKLSNDISFMLFVIISRRYGYCKVFCRDISFFVINLANVGIILYVGFFKGYWEIII